MFNCFVSISIDNNVKDLYLVTLLIYTFEIWLWILLFSRLIKTLNSIFHCKYCNLYAIIYFRVDARVVKGSGL